MLKHLLKTTLLLFALVVGSGNAWADDVSTLTFSSVCGGTGTADDGAKWTVSSDGTESTYDSTKGIHYGTSVAQVTYIQLSTSDISGTIKQVVVNASTATGVTATVGVTIGGSAFGGAAKSLSSSATDYTFTGSASGEIIVTVTKPSKATKAIYVKSIEVTYTSGGGGSTTVSTPSFSPAGGTYATAQSVTISCVTEDATIHYTTNGENPTESDATYSSPIYVTSGITIKAKAFKDGLTASSVNSASYTIKPNKPTVTADGATVTITGDEGCDFYYTTDNTTPSESSNKYIAPFEPGANCTIKVIACDTYNNKSDIVSFSYKYMPLAPKHFNSNYYVKVTDISQLENGDAILIVCESDNVAMSTNQKSNNRGEASVTISESVIDAPSADVQKLILVKDGDYYYFYTGSKYLYAASSSNNYLRSEDEPDDNAKAEITISSGNATITFQGSYIHNRLKHNNSNKLFSCYASSDTYQELVQIYKEVPAIRLAAACTDGGLYYGTYSSSHAFVVPADLVVSEINVNDGKLSISDYTTGAVVPANTGVMVSSDVEGAHTITLSDAAGTSVLGSDNMLKPSGDEGISAANMTVADTKFYRLTMHDGTQCGFWWGAAEGVAFDLGANKAYLAVPTGASVKGGFSLNFDEETGISLTPAPSLEGEGRDAWYDLSGRRVTQPTKGLYIVNGKKVFIK